jgi:hypothetical protein
VLVDKFKSVRYALKKWHTSLSKLKVIVQNFNKIILLLGTLEEQRPLFLTEFNFRQIVKMHLESLLITECNYWRKRCTIRWVKVGEDNTNFFFAMTTQRHIRNAISMLTAVDGRQVSDHEEMAGMLWSSYKNRMGMSEGISMQFDLANLLIKVEGLEDISMPFLVEEMELVIKQMPSDKAPGSDGFNGHFLKKCWPIIETKIL